MHFADMPYNTQRTIRLIAGLGNPGETFVGTRHNAGFMVIDKVLEKLRGTFSEKSYHNTMLWEGRCKGSKLILLKPLTFMNLSGEAVEMIARKNKISPEEILIVFDDMDLPLGRIRIREGGSSGGHNGVESVLKELGSANFARVRVGIGRGESNTQIDHVLSEFANKEKDVFDNAVGLAAEAVKLSLYRGISEAMNKYNGKNKIAE